MKKWMLSVLVLFCANNYCVAAPNCEATAKSQKLTGEARKAFLSACARLPASVSLSCEEQAAQKKLSGVNKIQFLRNCEHSAGPEKK